MTADEGSLTWLLTRRALAQVAADPHVRRVLGAGRLFELLGPRQKPLAGIDAALAVTFASQAEMAQWLGDGPPRPGIAAVLYDPEHWAFTPLDEQLDIGGYVTRAAAIAHTRGLVLIAAPAVTLTRVVGPRLVDRYESYIEAGIARAAAAADIVVVQAQGAERDVARYQRFVEAATAQVHETRPATTVLAGLSTNPPGSPVDARMLASAIEAVSGAVSGFWLNVPARGPRCPTCNPPRPDVGIDAIRLAFG